MMPTIRNAGRTTARVARRLPAIAACVAVLTGPAAADDIPGFAEAANDAERGLAIALEADRRDGGFGDTRSSMRMILRDGNGNSVTRAMRSMTLEMTDDGDRNLIVFEDPPDVRGTAFLTHSHAEGPDDQWLYLPALKRVKRIASSNRSGAFMSSEFSYEDLSPEEVEKYDYEFLREEALDGTPTWVIARFPVSESGYTRQVVWLDKAALRVQKVDYYDRKQSLLKTLTAGDYRQYLDRFWRPMRMDMVNHQTGKSTTLTWQDYRFGTGLDERDFNRNALSRSR